MDNSTSNTDFKGIQRLVAEIEKLLVKFDADEMPSPDFVGIGFDNQEDFLANVTVFARTQTLKQ